MEARTQAIIEENKRKLEVQQAIIEDLIRKVPQAIPLYEADVASGKKLSQKEKQMLEYILSLKKPPEWMPRIQKLLSNPQNFVN